MPRDPSSGIFPVCRPNLDIDGEITVVLKSGRHFTYSIWTGKGDFDSKRIVGLLTGPDNNRSYTNFAFVSGAYVNVWRRFRTESYEKHALLLQGKAEEHVDRWLQSGKCQKCGRKLTTPESIERGLGPECAKS